MTALGPSDLHDIGHIHIRRQVTLFVCRTRLTMAVDFPTRPIIDPVFSHRVVVGLASTGTSHSGEIGNSSNELVTKVWSSRPSNSVA